LEAITELHVHRSVTIAFCLFFYNFVKNIIGKKSYDRSCISWCMVTRDVFQVLKLHEPQDLKNITRAHTSQMNSRSYSLQSRRDIFRASTHIVIKFCRHLEFFGQWKPGERKKVLPRGWTIGKRKDRGGGGAKKSLLPEVIVLLGNSVRSQTEFLIGAARPYRPMVCQSLVKFFRFVCAKKKTRRRLSKVLLLVSIPHSRNLSSFYVNLKCLANYEQGKKTQLLHSYTGTRFGKSSIFQMLVLIKQRMTGKPLQARIHKVSTDLRKSIRFCRMSQEPRNWTWIFQNIILVSMPGPI